jgi:DNA-binding GntR family transcriptional regulator
VHERIRSAILRGELIAGSRVSPTEVAKLLGVSTMPVREAFRLLEEEGLLETSARRWTRVVVPDEKIAGEIYPLVGLLEEAAVLWGSPANAARLARLRAANDEVARAGEAKDVMALIDADARFHAVLVDASDNETLHSTLDGLKARIRLLEGLFFRLEGLQASLEQHAEIIAALERGDLAAAGDAVRRNWEQGLAGIRAGLASAEGQGSTSRA